MSRTYAEVIGDPISHSKSPVIHGFWLAKLGIDAEYRACHVRPDDLADYLAQRREDASWRGCNVTIPHKIAVLDLVQGAEAAARSIGAANTIFGVGAQWRATNTDIDGILAALPDTLMPSGANVCLLGTGGAARAALAACRDREVGSVIINARNKAAGQALLREFGLSGEVNSLDDASGVRTCQVLINATSLGMIGKDPMPSALLDHLRNPMPGAVVFDMVYSPLETELLRAAAEAGCRTVDGLAMLVGQAAAAFQKFFGDPAPRQHDAELRSLLTS